MHRRSTPTAGGSEILADAPHVLIYPGPVDGHAFAAARGATAGAGADDFLGPSGNQRPADARLFPVERSHGSAGRAGPLHRETGAAAEPVGLLRAGDTPPEPVTRAELGLRESATVFWSAQSLYKYLPQYDAVFARIARRAGDCQFVFLRHHGGPASPTSCAIASSAPSLRMGLDVDRYCVFLPRMSQGKFVAAAGLADIFLDSIGWSACNSALESLAHDLPIVTYAGPMMRGRHSAAILDMLGVPETIAHRPSTTMSPSPSAGAGPGRAARRSSSPHGRAEAPPLFRPRPGRRAAGFPRARRARLGPLPSPIPAYMNAGNPPGGKDSDMRFEGTSGYVATDDLKIAVNAAITLERPLLVKGEPGTGKTVLALEVAKAIGAPLIEWHVKSTTKAQQGLYEYDAVSRLRDSQLGDERVQDIRNYIKRGKLWDAFVADERPVLLIDEIDKADIEFPNDLLLELDRMEFFVYETGETVKARRRPIVVITSNNEKELPDAFLRRCFFHYIRFPDTDTMRAIIEVHFPGIKQRLVAEALRLFYEIRDVPGMKKKPSTSELLDWLKLLMVEDIGPEHAARARSEEADPAAARRADQERAGRAPVRTAGVHGAKRGPLTRPRSRVTDPSRPAQSAGDLGARRRNRVRSVARRPEVLPCARTTSLEGL